MLKWRARSKASSVPLCGPRLCRRQAERPDMPGQLRARFSACTHTYAASIALAV